MPFFNKICFFTIRFLALALFLFLFFGVGAYWLLTRSIPNYQKDYHLSGVKEEIKIIRDKYAVPHIISKTNEDAYFALGFVHAQDRLWQMTLMRRTAQGRLSEIFGKNTLKTDELMRRLDFYNAAERSVFVQTPETISALESYSAGVNAWIKKVQKGGYGRGAPEFYIFPGQISLWRPTDSLAIGKLMALNMIDSLWDEVLRTKLFFAVGETRARDLLPERESSLPFVLSKAKIDLFETLKSNTYTQNTSYKQNNRIKSDLFNPMPRFGMGNASNVWATSSKRNTQGKTLLASDPHNQLTAPSNFYLARMGLEKNTVIGASIPGMPIIFIGRSDRHGWGLSAAVLDDIDIIMEKLSPENSSEYLSPNGYKEFKKRRSVIFIKDEPPKEIILKWSENGPILPNCFYSLCNITPEGHVPAISWVAHSEPDTTMSGFIGFMQARNVEEMLSVGEYIISPSWNLIAVDLEKIAFQMIGRIPKRNLNHQGQGKIPAIGTNSVNLWEGFIPYSSNVRIVNPVLGFLGNTNNSITNENFPFHISHSAGDKIRISRLKRLINDRIFHTRDSFIEIQNDTVSGAARLLLPLITRNLWYFDNDESEEQSETLRKKALELLAGWTGDMNVHHAEPLIYNAWMINLQKRLIQDELGFFALDFSGYNPIFLERVFSNIEGAAVWCDIVQTKKQETCEEIARIALDEALINLRGRMGDSLQNWYWGDMHQAFHKNKTFGDMDYIKWFFNIVHPLSGADNTLSNAATQGQDENPFLNIYGSQFKTVYDFSDPDSSVYILSMGQSGHPFSKHYDDLNTLWRRGEYIAMSTDPERAQAGVLGITRLLPERGSFR